MNAILTAAPLAVLEGIRDVSGTAPVLTPELLPTHLPHVYLYTEKGPEVEYVAGDALAEIFGSKTLDTRSKYFNHQSVLANRVLANGGSLMVQRIKPDDIGPKARILLSAEVVAADLPVYRRNVDGSFVFENGAKVDTGVTIAGHKVRWHLNSLDGFEGIPDVGTVGPKVGSLEGRADAESTIYPILELEAAWEGAYGNNLGLRLVAPHSNSAAPMNTTLAESTGSYMYRLQLMERADANSSPKEKATLYGTPYIDFSFKEDAYNARTDSSLYLGEIFEENYEDIGTPGMPKRYAPLRNLHIYHDHLEAVLAMIGAVEAPAGLLTTLTIDAGSDNLHEVNPFTATNYHGIPYHTVELVGPLSGGLSFNGQTTHYAAGASDGTMDLESFDAAVRSELVNYGEGSIPFLDWALFPQSVYYDTGFSLDTKYAMLGLLAKRKDIYTILATQDVSQPLNTPAEDSSIALSLATYARNFPESEIHGTSVCRAMIFAHAGKLLNSKYKGILPLTIEFADKCAQWMSDGNGIWTPGLGFDRAPQNQIRLFRRDTLNISYKADTVRNRDWANGMVWAQNFDRAQAFWPALQTVYEDDSSILNTAINMIAAVDLQKCCLRSWRVLTGTTGLTDLQFIDRSDRSLEEEIRGKYDGYITAIPETTITANDERLGFKWSAKIRMFGAGSKNVGSYTIESARLADLTSGA